MVLPKELAYTFGKLRSNFIKSSPNMKKKKITMKSDCDCDENLEIVL